MLTLYNVISADGYIMTKDRDESFIPDSLWPVVLEVFKQYPTFVMGRKTYDAFLNYGDALLKPFEALSIRKVVVSRDPNFHVKSGYEVVQTPQEVFDQNDNVVVSSGSIFNKYLFEQNLIDKIILHQLPISLGEGIKPFDDKFFKNFTLISEKQIGEVKESIYNKSK